MAASQTRSTTTRTTPARKPATRKTSEALADEAVPEARLDWFVPAGRVKASDRQRLLQRAGAISMAMPEGKDMDLTALSVEDADLIPDLMDFVAERFTVSPEAREELEYGLKPVEALASVMGFVKSLGE